MDRMYINGRWSIYLIGCEFLNVLHVLLQFYITNKFLNDKFYDLGPTMIREGLEDSVTVLDEVFPKVTLFLILIFINIKFDFFITFHNF